MTAVTHLDPSFASVFAIEAVNEPIMDASQTPGYGTCAYMSPPLSLRRSLRCVATFCTHRHH